VNGWRAGARTRAWWLAVAAGSALVAADGRSHRWVPNTQTVLFEIAMSMGIVAGLWVWGWRPRTRMGPLMYLWPTVFVASDLGLAYPESRLASTVGMALLGMGPILVAQMALSYPTGKLEGRLAWFYVFWMGYVAQAIQNVFNMLYYDKRSCSICVPQATTYAHVGRPPFSFDWWNKGWWIQIICVLPIGLYLLVRRYLDAGPGARRTRGPLLATAICLTTLAWAQLFLIVVGDLKPLTDISYVTDVGFFGAAVTAFLGLAVTRRARSAVADLVVELGRGYRQGPRAALARAIGDPTLELALWLPDRGVWADEHGSEVVLPQSRDRAVTFVGDELAAIVHDPIFLDQPAMLEAVGAAARFALENERLQAQLRAQLAELRESRARVVRAGDDERRRLERDLHDGAQQRLLGLGMALQLLRNRIGTDDETVALLHESETELQQALAELRELARGIHPAVLVDQGLGAAVRTLADRSPVPVEVTDAGERLPPRMETAAYYVVAEALANVAKYSCARRAWVSVGPRYADRIRIEIGDDGIGGAAPQNGSGLRGLADRVGSLDGVLTIDSPPGGGTRLVAEFPCVS
jgi:signal transduction histidine kinase